MSGVPAVLALASLVLALSGGEARSQTTRTIKIVVPYSAGSPSDLFSRLLAEEISRARGPTIVVENRPGASASIGAELVARAVPDGNTLLVATTALVINPHLRKLSYDPLTSFEPICNLVSSPTILVVNGASPYRSVSRSAGCGTSQTGCADRGGCRSRVHGAHRIRDAQTCGQRQHDVCPVSRSPARDQRFVGRTCYFDLCPVLRP